ncbi:hypothetical protein BLNAU_21685 [Blattamonas nauphoetae]|uniref:Uncharacterized protein n=1 Tax=Blattamonas nauphoetae TaxID=2049346 RepID=A0ABQ9WZC6_9EUKA|nr:hypothetical protein BLNAU_21685 [Blattamonas nauphoetae]
MATSHSCSCQLISETVCISLSSHPLPSLTPHSSFITQKPRAADTSDADYEGWEDVVPQFMTNHDPCSVPPDALPLPSATPLTSLGVACACGCSFEAQAMLASTVFLLRFL